MKNDANPRLVQSVSRAIAILEAIAREPGGCSLTGLADALAVPNQTAQSLLRTLEYHGYVVQAKKGAPYRMGPALPEMVRGWQSRQDRPALARPIVEACMREIGENVLLAAMDGNVLTPVAESLAETELSIGPSRPVADTIHLRATGKVLLAHMGEEARRAILVRADFGKGTAKAPHDAEALTRQLQIVDWRGYAECRDEPCLGISAFAVPVSDASGSVRAALGCNLPSVRLSTEREAVLVETLKRTAEDIAKAWGWR